MWLLPLTWLCSKQHFHEGAQHGLETHIQQGLSKGNHALQAGPLAGSQWDGSVALWSPSQVMKAASGAAAPASCQLVRLPKDAAAATAVRTSSMPSIRPLL